MKRKKISKSRKEKKDPEVCRDKADVLASKIKDLITQKTLTAVQLMLKEEPNAENSLVIETIPSPIIIEKTSIKEKGSTAELKNSSVKRKSDFDRSSTGIPGLDDLIEGGIVKGDLIALAGRTGTGKSTFAMQFLVQGALEHGDTGVYITFGEDASTLRRNFASFRWDIKALEKKGKIKILDDVETTSIDRLVKNLERTIASLKAKRLVIDSITSLLLSSQIPIDPKFFTKRLYQVLKKDGCTTLLITSVEGEKLGFEIEEIVDGIIVLEAVLDGPNIKRQAIIRKMRGTQHSMVYQDVTISSSGIRFSPLPTGRIPKIC
jgi:KaiC/GvpD/RAD55 family RecA-like ATPase